MVARAFSQYRPDEDLGIVGLGLIGGSIAAAAKQRGFPGRIFGVGRSQQRLDGAQQAGLIDIATTDLRDAGSQCRLIVVCTPVDCIAEHVRQAAATASPGTVITDAGSVKASLCRELSGRLAEGVTFLGSHPLAGSEKQGYEHAAADLFLGRKCVITPDESTPRQAVDRVRDFWQQLGMEVVTLSAAEHDRILAETSHLPHIAASALAGLLSPSSEAFASTGFRDTTRIASGDPDLWRAILLSNAEEVLERLDAFAERIADFRRALVEGDTAGLQRLLQEGQSRREALDEQ